MLSNRELFKIVLREPRLSCVLKLSFFMEDYHLSDTTTEQPWKRDFLKMVFLLFDLSSRSEAGVVVYQYLS